MIVIVVASSSLIDESKSKFNGGGMRYLSHMKTWHMALLELDKTLTMFYHVYWVFFCFCVSSILDLFDESLLMNLVVLVVNFQLCVVDVILDFDCEFVVMVHCSTYK